MILHIQFLLYFKRRDTALCCNFMEQNADLYTQGQMQTNGMIMTWLWQSALLTVSIDIER